MLFRTSILLASITRSLSLATKSPIELKYFAARGAAETCRILLAIGGEEYKDTRFTIGPKMETPEFTAAKEAGELIMNLNRAPVLVTPEGTIGQSKAIERYLAKKFNLMGGSSIEEATVDCVSEHCRDIKTAEQRKGFSFFAKDKSEEEKVELRKEWYSTDLPTWLNKLEEAVKVSSKAEGFAVGSELTYADVAIFCLLRDCAPSDLEDMTKACEGCDTLNAIADNVAKNEKVYGWLKSRPESMF